MFSCFVFIGKSDLTDLPPSPPLTKTKYLLFYRKERGNCKICWTTVIAADFDTNSNLNLYHESLCFP